MATRTTPKGYWTDNILGVSGMKMQTPEEIAAANASHPYDKYGNPVNQTPADPIQLAGMLSKNAAQQPASQPSALPTAGQTARYNLFMATPTPQQAAVVNAATMQPEATPQPKPVTTPQANKPAGTVDNLSGTGFASQGNGQQQPITSMDDLAKAMGYTSPEEEDRLRKASVANQRMLAVVDALRHIGNIAHTVNYAPSQQFNSPVMEEHQRYLQGKAMRDRANQTYLTYQQAKAKQDAEARRWEADYKLKAANAASQEAYRKRQGDIAAKNAESLRDYREKGIAARNRQIDASISHQKEQERQGRQRIGIMAQNSRNAERHRDFIRKNKGAGSGGRGGTLSFRGKNGWYSKNMSANEANAFYNQTYDELKRRNIIKEESVLKGLPADIFGQKHVSVAAKKAAVDNAIYEHPEVGQLLQQQYEFSFDPRGVQQPSMATSQKPNVNFAPWNGGTLPGAMVSSTFTPNANDEDDEDLFDEDYDLSDISI